MKHSLKRSSSKDDLMDAIDNDNINKNKRAKIVPNHYNSTASPNPTFCSDQYPISQLPPSPPVFIDTPLPSPFPVISHKPNSIPTLKRFTITTRQNDSKQLETVANYTSEYTNINQILHEAHVERQRHPSLSDDTDMMMLDGEDPVTRYDHANTVLRQAFLQRHHSLQ